MEQRFCPVHLGDRFKDRYNIFRKLGAGSQSTVWLALDEQTSTYVAIKVCSAEDSEDLSNLAVTGHLGSKHVRVVLDKFMHESPNGSHLCLTMEPLGRHLSGIIERAWDYRLTPKSSIQWGGNDKYDAHNWSWRLGRRICYQLVLGLDYLHSQKVAHLDLHPGNIAFALGWDITQVTPNELQQEIWFPKPPDNQLDPDQEPYQGCNGWVEVPEELPIEGNETKNDSSEESPQDTAHSESDSNDSDAPTTATETARPRTAYEREQEEIKEQRKSIIKALPDGDISADPKTPEWAAANFKRTAFAHVLEFSKPKTKGPPNPAEPRYFLQPDPLHDRLVLDTADKNNTPFRVVIIDLGFSCAFDKCPEILLAQGRNYRSPEYVFSLTPSWKTDVWSLGLIIWYCTIGRPMFEWYSFGGDRLSDDYLVKMIEKVGPLPAALQSKWPDAEDYVNEQGKLLEPHHNYDGDPLYEEEIAYGDLKFAAERDKRKDMSQGDVDCFVDLMKMILQWEPEKRPNTAEILAHPFFKDFDSK